MCPVKTMLINKESSFEEIKNKMAEIREAYIESRKGKNPLFISESAILHYLRHIKCVKVENRYSVGETLDNYCKKNFKTLTSITSEIMSYDEMVGAVLRGSREYRKIVKDGVMVLTIYELTVKRIELIKLEAVK